MGFFSRIRAAMGEAETVKELLAVPPSERPVLVYAEDDYSWNQLEGYVREITSTHGRRVTYVTSDPQDPILDREDDLFRAYCVRESLQKFLPRVDSPVFLTTMPDLDSFHLKRPTASTCVYAFHSLNSTHAAYREGAFDAYDVFLCVGPYQQAELELRFEQIGKSDYRLAETGYYKLDRVAEAFSRYTKVHPEDTTVLVAPSWGRDNLLASVGAELIMSLADAGFRTIVRPHPAFFESIYPGGEAIVASLEALCAHRSNVVFEKSITTENSFLEADLMVSDWSGAGFEYALGTERPVLFVDVPRKVMNDDWAAIGLAPFEDRIRSEVGTVLPIGNAGDAGEAATSLIAGADRYRSGIVAVREREVFNFGTAAKAGASTIEDLIPR